MKLNRQYRQPTTLAQISSSRVYIHSRNARGCEYGRRETLVQCCSNAGPSSRGGVPRLRLFPMMMNVTPASFSKSISNLYHFFQR